MSESKTLTSTKDLSTAGGPVYGSALVAPDAGFTKGRGFEADMEEVTRVSEVV